MYSPYIWVSISAVIVSQRDFSCSTSSSRTAWVRSHTLMRLALGAGIAVGVGRASAGAGVGTAVAVDA